MTKRNTTPPNAGQRWTEGEEKKIKSMAWQGFEPAAIAHELGRSEDAVRDRAAEKEISLRSAVSFRKSP